MLLHINLFSAVFQTCSIQNDIAFFISIYWGQYALQGHATFKQTYKRKKYISKSDQLFLSTSALIKPIIANGILFNSKKYLPSPCISIPCFFFFIFFITCFFFFFLLMKFLKISTSGKIYSIKLSGNGHQKLLLSTYWRNIQL